MWSSSASSGSQKPSILASRIGLAWRPSCCQVSCSTSSSSVPMPPGRATNASERSNISRLRSCMSGVTISSCTRDQRVLALGQKIRNDAGHAAAVIQRGVGDRAHQADRAAAIDQPDVVLGKSLAERDGGFDESADWCRGRSRNRRRRF